MFERTKKALLVAVLAAGAVFGAATAHAQGATFRVEFGTTPHWTTVSGTRVQVVRDDERPNYDIFRVNGRYYVYNSGDWYVSDMPSGTFSYMEPRFVPSDLRRVPSQYWYSYPSDWATTDRSNVNDRYYDSNPDNNRDNDNDRRYDNDRSDNDRYNDNDNGASATFRFDMRRRPRWTMVSGTSVEEMAGPYRPGYDAFRYHHMYYVYANGTWYMGRHWDEPLARIDFAAVPSALAEVPRSHWRAYPATWPNPDYRRHHHRRYYNDD